MDEDESFQDLQFYVTLLSHNRSRSTACKQAIVGFTLTSFLCYWLALGSRLVVCKKKILS